MQELFIMTIREIVLKIPPATSVFEEFKIDFCGGGSRSFNEACRAAGADPQIVGHKIEQALALSGGSRDFEYPEKTTAADLIDYILEKHHVFTKAEITRLTGLMKKVCQRHGEQHPELGALQDNFRLLSDELAQHLRKEETVLFPFIKTLEAALAGGAPVASPPFRSVGNPVRMMNLEHDAAGEMLRKSRRLTRDFQVPADGCPGFQALYDGLQELEKDLHRHIELESNRLFPQAVELEQKIFDQGDGAPGSRDFVCPSASG